MKVAPLEMVTVVLEHPADHAGWRLKARELLARGVAPEQIVWHSEPVHSDLFGQGDSDACPGAGASGVAGGIPGSQPVKVSREFLRLTSLVACHRDPQRYAVLYRVLWRMIQGETGLLSRVSDADIYRLRHWARAVRRDKHKMRAFVRFRQTPLAGLEHFVAWFEPEHHILRANSTFFYRRFANMHWSISTPSESAHWDGQTVQFGPAIPRHLLPGSEPMEALWRTYFSHIFNPARLRTDAMVSEMPVKYWKNLPESSLISELIHSAGARTTRMVEAPFSSPPRYAAAVHRAGSEPPNDRT